MHTIALSKREIDAHVILPAQILRNILKVYNISHKKMKTHKFQRQCKKIRYNLTLQRYANGNLLTTEKPIYILCSQTNNINLKDRTKILN